MMINVGIVEDEKQIRESLTILINGSEGFSCVNAYETAEEAIVAIPTLNLDVVLMDIHLPEKDGIECIYELKPQCQAVQFLMWRYFQSCNALLKRSFSSHRAK